MGSLVTWSRPPVGQARPDPRSERRRLDRCDTLSSRLAELHAIRAVLSEAAEVVSHGWVQGAWFTVATPVRQVAVTVYDLRMVRDHPVTGACLVGSVVYAAGGPEMARTQLVQRTLDLTWHALHEDVEPSRGRVPVAAGTHDAPPRPHALERRARTDAGRGGRPARVNRAPGRPAHSRMPRGATVARSGLTVGLLRPPGLLR